MFLCVSANPSIDKRLEIPALVPGDIHRARSLQSFAGGKATHVATVLQALGETPHWMGPCGGEAGEKLLHGLQLLQIKPHTVSVSGNTRTNLELIDDAGIVTEILEPGPALSAEEVEKFVSSCKEVLEWLGKPMTVLMSGSLPAGAPKNLYARLIEVAHEVGCKAFLDTSGEPLREALGSGPDFVKPNAKEAAALLGIVIDSPDKAVAALEEVCSLGAQSAAISLGVEGIVYREGTGKRVLFGAGMKVDARTTVGCGDSAFAGFAKGIAEGLSGEETLKLAVACATANCLAKWPGAAQMEDIQSFRNQVKVQVAEGETKVR